VKQCENGDGREVRVLETGLQFRLKLWGLIVYDEYEEMVYNTHAGIAPHRVWLGCWGV